MAALESGPGNSIYYSGLVPGSNVPVTGSFDTTTGIVGRLSPNGTPDISFGNSAGAIQIANAVDEQVQRSFGLFAEGIDVRSDGGVAVGFGATVVVLTSDGAFDAAFDNDGRLETPSPQALDLLYDSNDVLYLSLSDGISSELRRLNSDGTTNSEFPGNGGNSTVPLTAVTNIEMGDDGAIYAVGADVFGAQNRALAARFVIETDTVDISDIRDRVRDLRDQGVITGISSRILTWQLSRVERSIERGRTGVAINQLRSAIAVTRLGVRFGQIPQAEGAELIDLMTQLISDLEA